MPMIQIHMAKSSNSNEIMQTVQLGITESIFEIPLPPNVEEAIRSGWAVTGIRLTDSPYSNARPFLTNHFL